MTANERGIDLRHKIYLILIVLGGIPLFVGTIMVWYTYKMQHLLTQIFDNNIASFQVAEEMETALINQKGFVTYYYLDKNPEWLKRFSEYRTIFTDRLQKAEKLADGNRQIEAVKEINARYNDYMEKKDRIIILYKNGEWEKGAKLHQSIRLQFIEILKLCEDFKNYHTRGIQLAQTLNNQKAIRLRFIVIISILISLGLALSLSLLFSRNILTPLAKMLQSTSGKVNVEHSRNIVRALGHSLQGIIQNSDKIKQELEMSRESLINSEKLALVGKLAAGMAHSIRNPFTSVKMRLFSLKRSLSHKLTADQKEHFDVISLEIRHIDAVVHNFLEFSRPPKLIIKHINPSDLVDQTLRLLTHRLKSYNVTVRILRKSMLPDITADPEQIKEVLINILINACEAMPDGGIITIEETIDRWDNPNFAVLKIFDTGSGIPKNEADKIFHPFFTTKKEGTGLGLSIAKRIMDEHKGDISIDSSQSKGACFILKFPFPKEV